MSSARIVHSSLPDATPEQARDARARAWAYVFSCWHAKQKHMPLQTSGETSNDSTAKGVSHVEHSSSDVSQAKTIMD